MTKNIETKIYGYDELINFFIELDLKDKIPNKFVISGKKGIGKSTFAYHLINYLFSKKEKFKYNINKFEINDQNKSFNLVKELVHPNFFLIKTDEGKEQIGIDKIRKSFDFINRTSMNDDYRVIMIDNAEFLNLNSSNALLKIIEEPNDKLIFILIQDSSYKMLDTIKSRCIVFKKNFSETQCISFFEKITNYKFAEIFNDNYLAKFMTCGELIFLNNYLIENNFQGKIDVNSVLNFYFSSQKIKSDKKFNLILLKINQIYLYQKNLNNFDESCYLWYNSFFKKVSEAKKFNLDIGNLFFEFQLKNLHE